VTVEQLGVCSSTDQLYELLMNEAVAHYEQREQELGAPIMREVERQVMLRIVDQKWREHLEEMDYLREGINLRAMGQKDPLTEWQREGYTMFEAMMRGVALDFVRYAMQVQVNVQVQAQPQPGAAAGGELAAASPTQAAAPTDGAPTGDGDAPTGPAPVPPAPAPEPIVEPALFAAQPEPIVQGLTYSAPDDSAAGGGLSPAVAATAVADGPPAAPMPDAPVANVPVVKSDWDKTPRNAPCPCGSGKKFKLCHGG
jgi:preprotein translocase subunit SecA